jgi:hypothetical protein
MGTTISGATGIDKVQDGTIVNADINSSAAIAGSKLVMPTGSVLQVKDSVFATNTSTTSTSFTNTGHYVNITPASTSSKFLIQLAGGGNGNHAAGSWAMTTFYRDSTELSGTSIGLQTLVGGAYIYGSHSISWMDSPNTTSEIGYKVYFRTNNGSNTAYYNWSDRGKVHLTVTEIAG